ncbi:N-acyl-D-amino-acid deacylase family protein [Nesterenkonia marinintestina]|uniref:N-acyl-D-amino-acid deacylase family protein n=1 Tax=Nesterenkonia marinintestina TaxID=2979865 RepID=UPI0021BEDDC8|nr:D-aminoacylase [Nesterenkonia sp. GX14115]
MGSTLLRGAVVVDGSGDPAVPGDVLITDDRIAAVARAGEIPVRRASQVSDLSGLTLMPGFIDVHAHSDNAPLLEDVDTSKTAQGVTTEINGNCGFTLAPVAPENVDGFLSLVRRIFPDHDWSWHGYAEFLDHAADAGLPTNFASLIGHNTLRIAAMGLEERPPSPTERTAMRRGLEEALAEGAVGLSTGLVYPPGVYSGTDEIVELAAALPSTAVYASHMRNEGQHLRRSIEETLEVAERAGVRCHLSHLKVADRRRWGAMDDVFQDLAPRRAGLPITQDVYPYTAASTMLTALLPPWMHAGGTRPLLERLRSAGCRDRVRAQVGDPTADFENYALAAGWENIVLAGSGTGRYDGASMAEIALGRGQDPVDCLADLLIEEELRATMIMHIMSEGDLRRALDDPRTMIGSDGLPRGNGGRPHPRGAGSFVRVLDVYVRRLAVMRLEEAVRRMTSLAAETFSLPGRGRIREGYAADLVAADMTTVEDRATYSEPTAGPRGIEHVWINGEPVVREGTPTCRRPGRVLRARH